MIIIVNSLIKKNGSLNEPFILCSHSQLDWESSDMMNSLRHVPLRGIPRRGRFRIRPGMTSQDYEAFFRERTTIGVFGIIPISILSDQFSI